MSINMSTLSEKGNMKRKKIEQRCLLFYFISFAILYLLSKIMSSIIVFKIVISSSSSTNNVYTHTHNK